LSGLRVFLSDLSDGLTIYLTVGEVTVAVTLEYMYAIIQSLVATLCLKISILGCKIRTSPLGCKSWILPRRRDSPSLEKDDDQ
jgi:hypothetical protein